MNKNKVTKLNTSEQNFQSNLSKLLRNEQEINIDIHNTVLNIIKTIFYIKSMRKLRFFLLILCQSRR